MSKASTSVVNELPQPILFSCMGICAITLLVLGAIGVRALTSGGSAAAPATSSRAAPSAVVSTTATTAATPSTPAAATAPEGAREVRARLDKDYQMGRHAAFVADLDELLSLDPNAAQDRDVRNAVVEVLMRLMVGGGENPDRIFEMLQNRMGTTGIDVLYELITTRGGSRAAKRATELLRDESVRGKGSPALRIAYDLRMSPCNDKPALFERAKSDGDNRTLGMLQELNRRCGRGRCCFPNDPTLRDAIDAMKARLNVP
jgi:hypothetical protein